MKFSILPATIVPDRCRLFVSVWRECVSFLCMSGEVHEHFYSFGANAIYELSIAVHRYFHNFLCFGLFDKVQQCEAYYGVAAVRGSRSFLVIFGWRYFRFGPVEWFWRSLIYMSNPCPEKRETVVAEPVPHGVSG